MIKISVIIPVYNVEKYLHKCLDSIVNQTIDGIEIITIDDGSTDSSLEILKSYKNKYDNISIIQQKNQGVSEARNSAYKEAKGKYIYYIDSDDLLKNDMLEKMYNKLEKDQLDIVICGYKTYFNSLDNKRNRTHCFDIDQNIIYQSNDVIDMMLNFKVTGHLWNKMFKKELLDEIGFEFEKGRYIQDLYPVFLATHSCKRIGFINEDLYYYRQREGSTVTKKNKKILDDYFHAINCVISYVNKKCPDVKENSLKVFKAYGFSSLIRFYILASDFKGAELYKQFKNSEFVDTEVKIIDFIMLKNLDYKQKLRILLWKLKLLHILYR